MTEAPIQPDAGAEQIVADYWGTDEFFRYHFPDGLEHTDPKHQYIECKVMNEGEKSKFQKLTNTDLTVNRDNTAKVKVDPVAERHTLIKVSVVGWNMFKGGEPVGYSPQLVDKWLTVAPPKIVEELERKIRLSNPWMQAEMTLEGIDEELERLYELRKQVAERNAGEAGSANK